MLRDPLSLDLPPGDAPVRIHLAAPDPIPDGFYVQRVALRVQGAVHPYLAVSPQRRLVPVDVK